MASGDFLDLSQSAVRSAQGDPTDTTGDLARGKAAINEAYLTVCNQGDAVWSFLEQEGQWTTTAGSDTYDFASIATAMGVSGATIREIDSLVLDAPYGSGPLDSVDWRGLEVLSVSSQESAEGTGTPVAWSKWESRIRLYPSPDQSYTLGTLCLLTPGEMTADADVPLVPLAWRHRVLVPYAAALLLEQEGGAEAGADYERRMSRYREAYREMRTALGTGRRPTFNVVAPGAFDHLPDASIW